MGDTVACGDCGAPVTEQMSLPSSDWAPCSKCGSRRRAFTKLLASNFNLTSHAAMLGEREGKHHAFRESVRASGHAAAADLVSDGQLSYSISGPCPQGEDATLETCNRLVRKLNAGGGDWGDPKPRPQDDVVDCFSASLHDETRILQIQVVRAIDGQGPWKELNRTGSVQEKQASAKLAACLQQAITRKAVKIPSDLKARLTLALDSTLLPAMAFDDVKEEYHRRFEKWTVELGFEAVWLVGPADELVVRLDQPSSS